MFLFALWTTHTHVESCARLSSAPPAASPLRWPGGVRCPRSIPFQGRGHRHARAAARTIRSTFPASDSGNVT